MTVTFQVQSIQSDNGYPNGLATSALNAESPATTLSLAGYQPQSNLRFNISGVPADLCKTLGVLPGDTVTLTLEVK